MKELDDFHIIALIAATAYCTLQEELRNPARQRKSSKISGWKLASRLDILKGVF